jgi:sugar phosphate isomerase/epimerase
MWYIRPLKIKICYHMKKFIIVPSLFLVFLMISTGFVSENERFGGVTLYTLRNQMDSHPEDILKSVADVGYKYIEVADYKEGKFHGMTPSELNSALADLGMVPLSAHMGMVTLENADQLIADVKAAGFKYFVIPVPPMGYFEFDRENRSISISDDLEGLVKTLTTLAEKCKAGGLEMLYHNHNFEFEENGNGIVPIEYLLENLDPELVNFEIDLYWAVKAEADPIAYFKKYPNRWKIWHVKDMDEQGRFAPVGTGSIDFAKMLKMKKKAGMEYYIVEQDQTFDGMEPLEAIRISHDGLKKHGFN